MYVSLSRVKEHLNIESTYTGDDTYLNFLIQVAEETVEKHICTNLEDLAHEETVGSTTTMVLPASLQAAILLYIGDLYNSREGNAYGVSVSQVPFSYDYLLSLWKNYGDTTSDEFTVDVIRTSLKNGYFDSEGNLIVPDKDEYGLKGKAADRIRSKIQIDDNGNIVLL